MSRGSGLRASFPDDDELYFAHAEGRAVLTHDRKHFRNLHKAGRFDSGMFRCTEDVDFEALAARIHLALSQVMELSGQVIRVTRGSG